MKKSPARLVHSLMVCQPSGASFCHEITIPYFFVSVSAFFLAVFTLL